MSNNNKTDEQDQMCGFAPAEKEADPADSILYRKAKTLAELDESSDRCLKHVSERLDQIEEEILAGSADKKTD